MITEERLRKLLREIRCTEGITGAVTVERALALIASAKSGSFSFSVLVEEQHVHKGSHSTWTTAFVIVTSEGFKISRMRWTSCPGCASKQCDEVDTHPVELFGDDEHKFFVKYGHAIVISEDAAKIIKAYSPGKYVLAGSEDMTMFVILETLRGVLGTLRKVSEILAATKDAFKSSDVKYAREQIELELRKLEFRLET